VIRCRAVCAVLVLLGCGGAPQSGPEKDPLAAPAPPPAKTLGALAPDTPVVRKAERPTKRYRVAFAGDELPTPDALEGALSLAGIVPAVGTSPAGVEVDSGGVLCVISKGERLPDALLPNPKIEPEIRLHGLSEAEAETLARSTATADVSCEADGAPVKETPILGEAIAAALAKMLKGSIYDPQTGRHWPLATWEKLREGKASRTFDVKRAVRVVIEGGGARVWVGTRGLAAFGRPDLEFFPVAREQSELLIEQLYVLADAIVTGDPVGDGTRLEVGPTTVMFWDRDAYAKTLPPAAAGVDQPALAGVDQRLAVVDPEAKPGDLKGLDRMVRRLTLR